MDDELKKLAEKVLEKAEKADIDKLRAVESGYSITGHTGGYRYWYLKDPDGRIISDLMLRDDAESVAASANAAPQLARAVLEMQDKLDGLQDAHDILKAYANWAKAKLDALQDTK